MSTLKEFENAPVGATANGGKWVKVRPTNNTLREWIEVDKFKPLAALDSRSNEKLAATGFTLDPATTTTAREALDLAWELASPVKEGQVIPEGTRYLQWVEGELREYTELRDMTVSKGRSAIVRTLAPLPDPEPEWLDAPAVLAAMDDCSWQKVWLPSTPGHWECTCCGVDRHWSKMNDVTPLYPKREEESVNLLLSQEPVSHKHSTRSRPSLKCTSRLIG